MDKIYKTLRAEEFHSLVEECRREFENWNPRSLDKIDAFLKRDSSCINKKYPSGKTALYSVLITENCPSEIVRLLLKYGANVNCNNPNWPSCLSSAICYQGFDIVKLLLYAGAKILATTGFGTEVKLLEVLDDLESFGGDENPESVLRLLVKHLYLENPDFGMERFVRRPIVQRIIKRERQELIRKLITFANECYREVQVMKSKNISINSSLFYFVKRRLSSRMAASGNGPPLSNKEFNQLISILADNDLQQYVELIANLVGTSTMKTKLQELKMYTKNCSGLNGKIHLTYDALHEVARFLSAADLLRLFIAYAPDKYVGLSRGNEHRSKRSHKYSMKDLNKRQKLK